MQGWLWTRPVPSIRLEYHFMLFIYVDISGESDASELPLIRRRKRARKMSTSTEFSEHAAEMENDSFFEEYEENEYGAGNVPTDADVMAAADRIIVTGLQGSRTFRQRMSGPKDWFVCHPYCRKTNHNDGWIDCEFCHRKMGKKCDVKSADLAKKMKKPYYCRLCRTWGLKDQTQN